MEDYQAFQCPDCGWAHAYDDPSMEVVYCVRCFREGRGAEHRCERLIPASQFRGAVALAEDMAEALDMFRHCPEGTVSDATIDTANAAWDAWRAEYPAGGR